MTAINDLMDMMMDGAVTTVAANDNGIDFVELCDEETGSVYQVSVRDLTLRLTNMEQGFSASDAPVVTSIDFTEEQARVMGRVLLKCADDIRERELEQLREARDAGAF